MVSMNMAYLPDHFSINGPACSLTGKLDNWSDANLYKRYNLLIVKRRVRKAAKSEVLSRRKSRILHPAFHRIEPAVLVPASRILDVSLHPRLQLWKILLDRFAEHASREAGDFLQRIQWRFKQIRVLQGYQQPGIVTTVKFIQTVSRHLEHHRRTTLNGMIRHPVPLPAAQRPGRPRPMPS